jgi:hypothetical protein
VLDGERVVRPLPSAVTAVAAGGGGRFLILYLPKIHKLAVFDASAARVVKYVPVEEDDVRFAAGRDKLLVVLPGKHVIQRWSLTTLEREVSVQLPTRGRVTVAAMGSASHGPLLLASSGPVTFLDPATLKPVEVQVPENRVVGGLGDRACIRVSADGKVFGLWSADGSPQGLQTWVLVGNRLQVHYEHDSAGHVTPGPDGRVVHTGRGLYTAELKPRKEENDAGAAYCVPAAHGPLYLSLSPGRRDSVAVHMTGHAGPLARLPGVDAFEGVGDREAFSLDRRYHLIPEARLLVTIPATADRLVLYRFDLMEVLTKADVDYLLVTSQPPLVARKGETYRYQLAVLSRKGGLAYRVDSGPKGMTISPQGLLTWPVPARTDEADAPVIITVTDRAGQEVFHTFTVSLRE